MDKTGKSRSFRKALFLRVVFGDLMKFTVYLCPVYTLMQVSEAKSQGITGLSREMDFFGPQG
jgi:hypothetical protein